MKTSLRNARSFTLIELLVSSLLAVMLLAIVVGVIRNAHAQSRAVADTLARFPDTTLLREQLRQDVVNSTHLRVDQNRLQLYGYIASHPRTKSPTYQLALVDYSITSGPDGSWLIREEIQSDARVGARRRRDVLWKGAAILNTVAPDDREDEEPVLETPSVPPGTSDVLARSATPVIPGMRPISDRVTITLQSEDQRVLCHLEILTHQVVN